MWLPRVLGHHSRGTVAFSLQVIPDQQGSVQLRLASVIRERTQVILEACLGSCLSQHGIWERVHERQGSGGWQRIFTMEKGKNTLPFLPSLTTKRIIFEQVHKRLPYVIPSVTSKIGELTGSNTAAIAVSTSAPRQGEKSVSSRRKRKRLAPTVLPARLLWGSPLAPTCHSLLFSVFLYPFVRVYSFHSPTHLRHCVCHTMPAFSLEERKALPPQLFHQHPNTVWHTMDVQEPLHTRMNKEME